jgi:hypothetical protein
MKHSMLAAVVCHGVALSGLLLVLSMLIAHCPPADAGRTRRELLTIQEAQETEAAKMKIPIWTPFGKVVIRTGRDANGGHHRGRGHHHGDDHGRYREERDGGDYEQGRSDDEGGDRSDGESSGGSNKGRKKGGRDEEDSAGEDRRRLLNTDDANFMPFRHPTVIVPVSYNPYHPPHHGGHHGWWNVHHGGPHHGGGPYHSGGGGRHHHG